MRSGICLSIARKGADACLEALAEADLAEIRLDLCGLDDEGIKRVFSYGKELIATFRDGSHPDEERKAALILAIGSGASMVDVELEAEPGYREEIAAAARRKGCRIIISHHDHERTPSREDLEGIVDMCIEAGADIVKIACKAQGPRDCARLLGLLETGRPMVVIGMGQAGRITRIAAPLLGAAFTFASFPGEATAPGQMDAEETARIIALVGGRGGRG